MKHAMIAAIAIVAALMTANPSRAQLSLNGINPATVLESLLMLTLSEFRDACKGHGGSFSSSEDGAKCQMTDFVISVTFGHHYVDKAAITAPKSNTPHIHRSFVEFFGREPDKEGFTFDWYGSPGGIMHFVEGDNVGAAIIHHYPRR